MTDLVTEPAPATSFRDHGRFADLVATLRPTTRGLQVTPRTLMIAGGVLAPLGLVLVVLGWYGAAHTPYTFEQVPYLISGGLIGLSLVVLGSFLYFAYWLTELVRETRAHTAVVTAAIDSLRTVLEPDAAPAAAQASNGAGAPVELVATQRGSMAHRSDCVVVTGKVGLRRVGASEGLVACKLCDPYD